MVFETLIWFHDGALDRRAILELDPKPVIISEGPILDINSQKIQDLVLKKQEEKEKNLHRFGEYLSYDNFFYT